MPWRKKGAFLRNLLVLIAVAFIALGILRLKSGKTVEQLPEPVSRVADSSANLLDQISNAVASVREKYRPWNLTLVNRWNPVPDNWESEFTELRYGKTVDTRMYPYLQEMFDACRADGLLPVVYSGYRSKELQQELYDNKVAEYMDMGYSEEEAKTQASQWVAVPGTSEHQLGLAADIDSEDTEQCSDQAVWDWLSAHCQEYGFILRYPADKTEITGIQYEPWHFRYVGKEAAKEIMERGITLEEYLDAENAQ